jgi:hypothetical protein
VDGQHEQLATAENLTTLSILTASFSKIRQIRETRFISRAPSLKIISFKILKTVGEPYFGL